MIYKNEHGFIGKLIAATADGFYILEDKEGTLNKSRNISPIDYTVLIESLKTNKRYTLKAEPNEFSINQIIGIKGDLYKIIALDTKVASNYVLSKIADKVTLCQVT